MESHTDAAEGSPGLSDLTVAGEVEGNTFDPMHAVRRRLLGGFVGASFLSMFASGCSMKKLQWETVHSKLNEAIGPEAQKYGITDTPVPVFNTEEVGRKATISLDDSAKDRWKSAKGSLDKTNDVKGVLEEIIAAAENVISPEKSGAAWYGYKLGSLLAYPFHSAFGSYIDEAHALADEEKLPRHKVTILQRLYTLGYLDPFGCSTCVIEHMSSGNKLHFRTLDWPMLQAMQRAAQVHTFKKTVGGKLFEYQSAGMYGMVGLLSAAKAGFSVTINYAPKRLAASLNNDPLLMLRKVFDDEKIATYEQAVAALSGQNKDIGIPAAPVFYTIAGCGCGEACVIEWGSDGELPNRINIADQTPKEINSYRILVQTNHYDESISPLRVHNKEAWIYGTEPCQQYATPLKHSSEARKRALKLGLESALIRESVGFDPDTEQWKTRGLWDVYEKSPLYNYETAQWVHLDPQAGSVKMWVRKPQTLQEFSKKAIQKCFGIAPSSGGVGKSR